MQEDNQPSYVRLSGSESPAHANQQRSGFFFPKHEYTSRPSDATIADSDDDLDPRASPAPNESNAPGARRAGWWKRLARRQAPPAAQPQSDYLTLIPLSDSRLKPQRTQLIVAILLFLGVVAVSSVFVLVPRGVTVGTIQVHSSQISFNTSKSTYQILLTATIPVYNPNYLSVELSGTINVSFYDQQAGYTPVRPVWIAAGAQPQVVSVDMDASSVPQKYLFTIYTQCFTFPEKLIFFLTGSLQAVHLGQVIKLPLIDNYFIISCNQSPDSGPDEDHDQDKDKEHKRDKDDKKDKGYSSTVEALPLAALPGTDGAEQPDSSREHKQQLARWLLSEQPP